MNTFVLFVWICNVIVDTAGHMAFKRAAIIEHDNEWHRWRRMLSSLPIWIGIFCFCIEFALWLVLLSVLPLSIGVLLGAFNMVAIMLAGRIIFRELFDPMRVLGIVFISVGVALAGGFA